MEQIKQIIPADDWSAVFAYRNKDTGEVELETLPIGVWALVEENGEQYITGYTPADHFAEPCSKDPNVVGYLAPGESAEKYREEAEREAIEWEEPAKWTSS